MVKNLLSMQETWVRSRGREDPLEKGKATHSSILGWRILGLEEPGRSGKESDTTEQLTLFFTFKWILRLHSASHTLSPPLLAFFLSARPTSPAPSPTLAPH